MIIIFCFGLIAGVALYCIYCYNNQLFFITNLYIQIDYLRFATKNTFELGVLTHGI